MIIHEAVARYCERHDIPLGDVALLTRFREGYTLIEMSDEGLSEYLVKQGLALYRRPKKEKKQ